MWSRANSSFFVFNEKFKDDGNSRGPESAFLDSFFEYAYAIRNTKCILSAHNVIYNGTPTQIDRQDLLDLFGSKNILQSHLSKELLGSQGATMYCKCFLNLRRMRNGYFLSTNADSSL